MLTEIRTLDFEDSIPHLSRIKEPAPPCSSGFDKHDWAKLVFTDMVVAIRCQTCAREPLDIMAEWRMGEWGAR